MDGPVVEQRTERQEARAAAAGAAGRKPRLRSAWLDLGHPPAQRSWYGYGQLIYDPHTLHSDDGCSGHLCAIETCTELRILESVCLVLNSPPRARKDKL